MADAELRPGGDASDDEARLGPWYMPEDAALERLLRLSLLHPDQRMPTAVAVVLPTLVTLATAGPQLAQFVINEAAGISYVTLLVYGSGLASFVFAHLRAAGLPALLADFVESGDARKRFTRQSRVMSGCLWGVWAILGNIQLVINLARAKFDALDMAGSIAFSFFVFFATASVAPVVLACVAAPEMSRAAAAALRKGLVESSDSPAAFRPLAESRTAIARLEGQWGAQLAAFVVVLSGLGVVFLSWAVLSAEENEFSYTWGALFFALALSVLALCAHVTTAQAAILDDLAATSDDRLHTALFGTHAGAYVAASQGHAHADSLCIGGVRVTFEVLVRVAYILGSAAVILVQNELT